MLESNKFIAISRRIYECIEFELDREKSEPIYEKYRVQSAFIEGGYYD
jgi:hypothetical protein